MPIKQCCLTPKIDRSRSYALLSLFHGHSTTATPRGVKRKADRFEANYVDGGGEFFKDSEDPDGDLDAAEAAEERQQASKQRCDQGKDAKKDMYCM